MSGIHKPVGGNGLAKDLRRRIAGRFLPNRNLYWHVRAKLATDPMYPEIADLLADSDAPLLDLGCGIGLLAHCLRARGIRSGYVGVDNDAKKIATARETATQTGLPDVSFSALDLADAFPAHSGNVALLDVLQYLSDHPRAQLLGNALASIAPDARLILRTGLEGGGWRTRFTRGVDRFAAWVRWMNAAPKGYPTRSLLEETFARHGMQATFRPAWGRLPFNNWLVIVEHRGPSQT